jgi:hypothetical protein
MFLLNIFKISILLIIYLETILSGRNPSYSPSLSKNLVVNFVYEFLIVNTFHLIIVHQLMIYFKIFRLNSLLKHHRWIDFSKYFGSIRVFI